jgi:exodeoxyribonuclease VII large subunit
MYQNKMQFTPVAQPVLSVSQLNNQARAMLERSFGQVQVAGEISNLKLDRSGHCYLSLKDSAALVSAVMFRRDAQTLNFALDNGLQVVASGQLTVYGPSGRYQLIIKRLALKGAGALQATFDALKARLQAEGLFDPARKRPLPLVPRRVAIVTSLQGAVLRDIVHVSRRRYANADLLVLPTRVQGADCAAALRAAVLHLSSNASRLGVDVLIVARGGGSLEDLWGFNDEALARAIAACQVPVVSAVGHETDYTICDFVADVRAPTPSAAAELVFPVKQALNAQLHGLQARGAQALQRELQRQRYRLRALTAELGDGRRTLWPNMQRLAAVQARLEAHTRRLLVHRRRHLQGLEARIGRLHPQVRLAVLRGGLTGASGRMGQALAAALHSRRQRLQQLEARLQALSPLAVLGRGYAIVLGPGAQAVRRPEDAPPGSSVAIRLASGQLQARIEEADGRADATSAPALGSAP